MGDLKTHCRVRVAPKLPFTADFSKVPLGRTPAAWVNTQGKFSVIEGPKGVADHPIFSKRNNNPNILVARANAYIGAPTLSDYTVEVDEYGTKVKTDMPDMGCGNSRYELALFGNDQKLHILSWDAQSRIDKNARLPVEAGHVVSPEVQGVAQGRQGARPGQGLAARRQGAGKVDPGGRRTPTRTRKGRRSCTASRSATSVRRSRVRRFTTTT